MKGDVGKPTIGELKMPNRLNYLRNVYISFLTIMLSACSSVSVNSTDTPFRDDVLLGHRMCMGIIEGEHIRPCLEVNQVTFVLYSNSPSFTDSVESVQEYIMELMTEKLDLMFAENATYRITPLPFSTSLRNYLEGEVKIRITFTTYPEERIPPMVSLLISSKDTLSTEQAVCKGDLNSGTFCLDELKQLIAPYFDSEFKS